MSHPAALHKQSCAWPGALSQFSRPSSLRRSPSRMSSCSTKKGKEGKQGRGHGHSRIQGSGGRGQSGTWLILFWALTLFSGSAACRPPGSAEMRTPAASASAARFERIEAFCGLFSRSRACLASCWTAAGRGQEHACAHTCSRRLGAGPARPYPHQVLANKTWRSCFAIYPAAWSDLEPERRPARRGAKLFWHSFTISLSI